MGYDRYISDRISDIVGLVVAFMALGFIAMIVVRVFRARNGAVGWRSGGVEMQVVDLEMGNGVGEG